MVGVVAVDFVPAEAVAVFEVIVADGDAVAFDAADEVFVVFGAGEVPEVEFGVGVFVEDAVEEGELDVHVGFSAGELEEDDPLIHGGNDTLGW